VVNFVLSEFGCPPRFIDVTGKPISELLTKQKLLEHNWPIVVKIVIAANTLLGFPKTVKAIAEAG
jgi:hypothetical protein